MPDNTKSQSIEATRPQNDTEAALAARRSGEAQIVANLAEIPKVPGYELIEEIGRGGMGCVWRARDVSFNREVAVKLLQVKGDIDRATKRFLDEAQLTGQLQHPGIPAAHQVGRLADGQPFLAMKLIRGQSLARLLAEGKAINIPAVFEAICQAVGYAHAHGVIHRDLKPANVMVGAFGEVQVMDWGLAKLLTRIETPDSEIHIARSDDELTQDGTAMGTAAYMPPEQARGELNRLGPPSDVFGLGGILCAMLTGKPPFLMNSGISSFLKAQEGDVTEAFTRLDASAAEPELVALCKRCLAPEPAERPAHGQEVAAMVAAIRAAAAERARQAEVDLGKAEVRVLEQRKRRRVQLTLGAGIVVASLIGGGIAVWKAIEARRARDATEAEAKNVEVNLKFFQEVLSESSPSRQAETGRKVVPNPTIKAALDYTAMTIGTKFPGQPLREAGLRDSVGRIYFQLGDYEQAKQQFQQSLAIRREKQDRLNPELLSTVNDLGSTNVMLRELITAKLLLEEALAGRRQILHDDPAIYQTLNNLGMAYEEEKDYITAEKHYREALAGRARLLGDDHLDTLKCVNNLGKVLYNQSKYELAEPLLIRALEGRKNRIGKGYQGHPDYITTLGNLAQLYYWWQQTGYLAKVEPLFREVVALSEKISPEGWTTAEYRSLLAECLAWSGKYSEADVQISMAYDAMQCAEGIDDEKRKAGLKFAQDTGDGLHKRWGQREKQDAWQKRTAPKIAKP